MLSAPQWQAESACSAFFGVGKLPLGLAAGDWWDPRTHGLLVWRGVRASGRAAGAAVGQGVTATGHVLNAAAWLAVGDKGEPRHDLVGDFERNGRRFEVLHMNGVWNTEDSVRASREALSNRLRAPVSYIHNKTGLVNVPRGTAWAPVGFVNSCLIGSWYDVLQSAAEQFGMTDETTRFHAEYVNARLRAAPGLVMILVAHSQGGAKLKQSFDLVDPGVRDRTYVITAAGAQVRGFPRAAEAWRVNKAGDLICSPIGNSSARARVARAVTGEGGNDTLVEIPADRWLERVPPIGLGNHPYVRNYNDAVAGLIDAILNQPAP